jgi:serine/threonine protein kinase
MEFFIGARINDRYEVKQRLYVGSMSKVFKAWDHQKKEFVVIKTAINNDKYPSLVDCLKREVMALKRLNHPRIVRMLGCGDTGESHFIVLEYIHGTEFARYIGMNGRLSVGDSVPMVLDILEGLEVMHQKGFVHRDIKLENLMVTGDGIKIIDLGLVRFISPAGRRMKRLTSPGCTVGTPQFMPPEQLNGRDDLDGRADLYACGVVLYEILTGVLPFVQKEKGASPFYCQLPRRPFSEVQPSVNVPDKVQAIIWKALEPDPNIRFQTVAEMREALLATKPSAIANFWKSIWL